MWQNDARANDDVRNSGILRQYNFSLQRPLFSAILLPSSIPHSRDYDRKLNLDRKSMQALNQPECFTSPEISFPV